jgi:hypothetical protein
MDNNPKPTFYIDSSGLKLLTCWRKFYNKVIKGRASKDSRMYYAAYGSAGHKFTELYYKSQPLIDCLQAAIDYYKPYSEKLDTSPYEFRTTNNLINVLKQYAITYPREVVTDKITGKKMYYPTDFTPLVNQFGDRAIEFKFSRPLYSCDLFNLVLCGTIDLACSYAGHSLLLVDYKFTGTQQAKSDAFLDDFSWDIQPMLYSMYFKEELGLAEYPPVMIRGVFCKKCTKEAEKKGIFDGVLIKDSPIMSFKEAQMNEFKRWLDVTISYIVSQLTAEFKNEKNSYMDYNMAACKFCDYHDICKLPLEHQQGKIDYAMTYVPYEPLKFRD